MTTMIRLVWIQWERNLPWNGPFCQPRVYNEGIYGRYVCVTVPFVHHLFDVKGLGESTDGELGSAICRNVRTAAKTSRWWQRYQVASCQRIDRFISIISKEQLTCSPLVWFPFNFNLHVGRCILGDAKTAALFLRTKVALSSHGIVLSCHTSLNLKVLHRHTRRGLI